ncbi:MAG TPA: ABC transporter permease [Candidatus Omnitrophica bacterium]|nr:ABC transporter permease [Candidatus Omnitrophota bacterium]
MPEKIIAFIKKDFLNEASYKLPFLLNFIAVFANILIYFFIDLLFGKKITPHLEAFGVHYFAYVLLGTAFFSYAGVGLGSFASRIQREQVEGTLESILSTPTKISTILSAIGLWNLIAATFDLIIYILLAIFVFKIDFSHVNPVSTLIILLLTITSFSGLGILSASFIIVLKRGNPIGWLVGATEGLLGGVYFPITVFPAWLQFLAGCLPITYAIQAIQLSVYKGYGVAALAKEITFLLLFSVILIPLGMTTFACALKKTKLQGTLGQY